MNTGADKRTFSGWADVDIGKWTQQGCLCPLPKKSDGGSYHWLHLIEGKRGSAMEVVIDGVQPSIG